MAVRNFWVEVDIDGYKSELRGGPRSKNGGLSVTLYQRNKGEIMKALTIECRSDEGGKLVTVVKGGTGETYSSIETVR